ncbi:pyridoxal-phosphate dependent enzyme [Sphingomonas sp.]|uniref:pyridoxal-phosphate dependent enzyme n=1 Tax=Sphingomonas sp. TaxID=28214 RepID=UPI0038655CC1
MIAASAGNHAQAVAYHGKRLGIPVTIVMPNPTPTVKVTQTEGHGARVVLHGETFDDAYDKAREMEAEEAMVFVHPFDDAKIIAGTGTIALEMLAVVPDLDVLVVPIGGGGLISGMAIAAKTLNPAIEVIGVEAELYPSMKNVVEGLRGRIGGDTLAEGIAVKEPGQLTRAIPRRHSSSRDKVRPRPR